MPDLPSTPRKAVSSTSAAARSQPQKKPGAPKPKGAVRAKSGCYTCRIRRKKCDEQPNEHGACQTCVRLRLQCLGFGAKRPDWMRENNSVTELREKIKTFLASQGMIKGHSGSGPRSTDGEPPVLILVEALQNPSNPSTPTLSQPALDGSYRPQGLPPNMRDGHYHPHAMPPPPEHYPTAPPKLNHHDPSRGGQGLPTVPGVMYSDSNSALLSSPASLPLLNSPPSSWPNGNHRYLQHHPSLDIGPPTFMNRPISQQRQDLSVQPYNKALHSSFGPLYTEPILGSPSTDDGTSLSSSPPASLPYTVPGYDMMLATNIDPQILVNHYLHNVVPIQYLMADNDIQFHMHRLIQNSRAAEDAACMLAAMHMYRTRMTSEDMVQTQFNRLLQSLPATKDNYTEGDAMAGLHLVSTFLFKGGRGAWHLYLRIASKFVSQVFQSQRYYGAEDVLRNCNDSTRFIIKTTFWFDVLASVTTLEVPKFLEDYRLLFNPSRAFVDDPESNGKFSMLPTMGCENHIVLAIAEISNLASWKQSQESRNCLSIPILAQRGADIEAILDRTSVVSDHSMDIDQNTPTPGSSSLPSMSMSNGFGYHGPSSGPSGSGGGSGSRSNAAHSSSSQSQPMYSDLEQRRRLTNDIFHAAARVYLHSVLSGECPECPEIMSSVQQTIELFEKVQIASPAVKRAVVRNVVFAIAICGCLTDDPRQRAVLEDLFRSQDSETVGNLQEVESLIRGVWAARKANGGKPVSWREIMQNSNARDKILLLV